MLTPRFNLEQDDKYVIVTIYAPFTNVSETEVFMDAQDFRFFSKPYFLRLHLPGQIEENEEASAVFDAASLSFIVKCPKVCNGKFFTNLDMISELCKPPGGQNVTLIEDLDGGNDHDWYFDQNVVTEEDEDFSENCCGIGFGLTYKNVFERLLAECQEVLDIKNPGQLSLKQRFQQQLALEGEHFDSDHYLADLLEPDDTLKEILHYDFDLSQCTQLSDENRVKLVEMSKVKVKSNLKDIKSTALPEKEHTVYENNDSGIHGSKLKLRTLCAINELIFAYCYDLRTNLGEHCSESAWTIAKLCPSLTCSTMAKNCRSSTIGSLRRSLIYPIVRHYDLSTSVHIDAVKVWSHGGKVSVLKILLEIMQLFQESEGRYIFNQLYLQHYVTWIQSVKSDKIAAFAQDLSSLKLNKEDLDLDLTQLEKAAQLVQQEYQEEKVIQGIENLCANESDSDDSESETSGSSDSDDDDESTTASDSDNKDNDNDA